jgi:small subunit ribosomal protein S1
MTNAQGRDEYDAPPALEESYWASLLNEHESVFVIKNGHEANGSAPTHEGNGAAHDIQQDWQTIQQITERDEVIELRVIGFNRGGVLVEWRSLRGFVPSSQLLDFPSTPNIAIRRNALNARVGHMLRLRVIEIEVDKNRLILSERAAQVRAGERANILHTLNRGDTVSGVVTNLVDFGAFVDLGGLEGLIHISELSWGRVSQPSDLLKRGQAVQAYVLDLDRHEGRIALSLKRLHPDPWATVEQRYTVGQIIEGEITNVVDFGAFASVEDGLEGLIHVSELAEGHFLHPRNVVNEGQRVRARIMSIDGHGRRLGLTLRLTD